MQAAVVAAPCQCQVAEVPLPEPSEGEARVRIEGCGICGSNLAPWEGRPWFRYPLAPGELGHEGWGYVDALGKNVKSLKEGDRVALLSYRAYAEYDIAPESALIKLPRALHSQPFPGEALGCAMNVFRRCDIRPGSTVAIVGVGFLGAVLTALSAHAGAQVLAISRRPFALDIARRMGAQTTLQWTQNQAPLLDAIKKQTGGKGCERVIEATGTQAALDLAGELTTERGTLIIAGYHQDGPRQVNLQLWNWRGLDVINAHERDPLVYRQGVELAIEAISSGQLAPAPLYTHNFQLSHLGAGLDAMRERREGFLKAWVSCTGGN
jgi:threonine dehydrogenase-like Zn-dependent dehydrogenase